MTVIGKTKKPSLLGRTLRDLELGRSTKPAANKGKGKSLTQAYVAPIFNQYALHRPFIVRVSAYICIRSGEGKRGGLQDP